MKKVILFAAAALMMASCSLLQKSTTSTTDATTTTATTAATTTANPTSTGANAGTAMLALYKQYQADGKFNANNLTNIANAAALIANCQDLKSNYSNKEYLKQFGLGLMSSAASLVNTSNVNSVTDALVNVATQSETATNAVNTVTNAANTAASVANSAASTASSVASAASSITSLLSLFGK